MAEKEGAKKWLVLLVILFALSLVVDLLSLNVLYTISSSGDLGGELGLMAVSSSSSSWKDDACVAFCSDDCSGFWSEYKSSCDSNCKTQYGGPAYSVELKKCLSKCKATTWTNEECAADCRGITGNPDLGDCYW